jgi:hypothetical protein
MAQSSKQQNERITMQISARIPERFRNGRGIISSNIQRARKDAFALAKKAVRDELTKKGLRATNRLFESIDARWVREVSGQGGGWYTFEVFARGQAGAYLPFVELGRPPGYLPVPAQLLLWMRARNIPAQALGNIQEGIFRKGTKARYPMRDARAIVAKAARSLLETAVKVAGQEWIEG